MAVDSFRAALAQRWPSIGLIVVAAVVWTAVAVELAVLAQHKVAIQSSFCDLSAWLRETFDVGADGNSILKAMHYATDSFLYMQLCCFMLLITQRRLRFAGEMYAYIVTAHVIKNFSKSFIASPRGFWFCTVGHAISCGSGYSLPSGHSMMSLATLLFLVYRLPEYRGRVLAAAGAFEAYTIFEIVYLGTHTPTDVVIGFTFAIAYFALYRLWLHRPIQPLWQAVSRLPEAQLALGLMLTAVSYQLELLENAFDQAATHPDEWQANYTSYCRLAPGTAAERMRNSSAFSKTAMVGGLSVAWYLRRRLRLDTGDGVSPWPFRLVRTFLGWYVFGQSKLIVKALLGPVVAPTWPMAAKYLPQFFQPLLLLVVLPALAQLFGWGRYRASNVERVKNA